MAENRVIKHTQQWVIKNFAKLPSDVGQCVESPRFQAGGREWYMRVSPGGEREEHKGWLCVHVTLDGAGKFKRDAPRFTVPFWT